MREKKEEIAAKAARTPLSTCPPAPGAGLEDVAAGRSWLSLMPWIAKPLQPIAFAHLGSLSTTDPFQASPGARPWQLLTGSGGVQGSPSVPGNPLVLAAFSYLRAELVESQRAVTRSFFQVPTNALPSPGSLLRMYEDSSISPASSHYLCGLMLHWKDPERSGGSGGSGARGSERG